MGLLKFLFGKSKKQTKKQRQAEIDDMFIYIINHRGYLMKPEGSLSLKHF
jgi:hypothetical protein